MLPIVFRLAGLLLLGFCASCVPSNVLVLPEVTNDSELAAAGNGVLLLQVADTTPYGTSYPVNQVTLAPKDVNEDDESKFPRLLAVDSPGDSTRFFFAVLPANEYSLSSLRAYYSFRESFFSNFYPAGIELGTFSIEPGKVTDLGTIAVYVRRTGEDYLLKTVRTTPESRTASLLHDELPGLEAKIENTDFPLLWHPDGYDGDRRGDYINAVNRQIVFSDPYLDDAAGVVQFPSRLGVVVQRDRNGEWTLDAIPSDAELRLVTQVDSQNIVVTEFDEIYRRTPDSEGWELLAGPPGAGELMYIGSDPGAGVYAVKQEPEGVTIWSAPSLDEDWNRAESIRPELSFLESLDQSFFAVNQDIRDVGYAASGGYLFLILREDLYRFDLRTSRYEELRAPNAKSLQVRNGIITVRASGLTVSSSVSFDAGETWKRYTGKLYDPQKENNKRRSTSRPGNAMRSTKLIGHPVFLDERRGFAVHKARKSEKSPFLVVTSDGAETWRPASVSELPEGCSRLVLATEKELLLGCFLSGEFYRSTDAGLTWTIDRAPSES